MMRKTLPLFMAFVIGSVSLIAFTITVLFSIDLTANFYSAFDATSIGGFTDAGLTEAIGQGWAVLAIAPLGIIGAMVLAVLIGDLRPGDPPNPPRGGSGPF